MDQDNKNFNKIVWWVLIVVLIIFLKICILYTRIVVGMEHSWYLIHYLDVSENSFSITSFNPISWQVITGRGMADGRKVQQ